MHIGIYNRYWNTRGGGERYIGTLAETLLRDHQVTLISEADLDINRLSSDLNLDLSKAERSIWPQIPYINYKILTREYDLFINSTYFSRLPSQAKHSAYLAFFPQPAPNMSSYLFERLALPTISFLTKYRLVAISQNASYTGTDVILNASPDSKICVQPRRASNRLIVFGSGISTDSLQSIDTDLPASTRFQISDRGITVIADRQLDRPFMLKLSHKHDISFMTLPPYHKSRCIKALRHYADSAHCRAWSRSFLNTYDTIIAISEYTANWIQKRWCRDSFLLPPPIKKRVAPSVDNKSKVILSVGRFFAGNHNKKHLDMIAAFRSMCDDKLLPCDWELHLVGRVHHETDNHRKYFNTVCAACEGYPIKLITEATNERVNKEYKQAAIFWHAAGLNEHDTRNPERFEHFGMSTCEAMSAGCIPVVIAKAGQLETVEHEQSGFLFETEKELIMHTLRVIKLYGTERHQELMTRCERAASAYDRNAFDKRVDLFMKSFDIPKKEALNALAE